MTLYQVGNADGFYYLELSDLDAGSTIEFTFVAYYPSTPTEGGSAVIYGEIGDTDNTNADGTPSGSAYTAHQITWSTEPEEYTVVKKTSGSAGFDYDEDEDTVFLTGLKYTITVNKTSNHTSYGKDYVETAVFTDVLSLPDGLAWRDGLAEAIAAGNWYVTSSKIIHVIVNGVDYALCTFADGTAGSMSNISMKVDDSSIVITWMVKQTSDTTDIRTSAMTVTYGDHVIEYTGSKTLSGSSVSFSIPNSVEAEFTFNYSSEIQTSQSNATAYATLSSGTLIVYMNDLYKGVSSSTNSYYMGASYNYWIMLENDEALPYYGLRYIEDTLCDWLYLEADEMEELLNDDHALAITINNATLYETISDEVTSTDGSLVIVDQQMEGTGTSYGDNVTSYGTAAVLRSEDTVKATDAAITFAWNGDNLEMSVSYDGTSDTAVITSVSDALSDIGYFVTNEVTYTLLWDFGEDYVLTGNTRISFVSYDAVIKDTFMRISGDLYWDLLQNDDAFSNDNVLLETLVTNYVAAYGDDYGSGNESVLDSDSVIKGDIYRDFALVKGYTISRDDQVLEDGTSITDGDIIDYYADVKHEGTGSYSGLPLVDKMSAGQTLLVPAESNTALIGCGLETETVDGVGYYRLTTGIYEDVFINSDTIADRIEVNEDGTFIYCYIQVSGTGITEIRYKAIVDTQELSGMEFSVCNEVWLNDHETHRLYDVTTIGGSKLTIDKLIVTKKGIAASGDETTRRTVLSEAGTQVTYRLALENNSASEVTVTGADVYDELPFSISDSPWTADDITISVVTDDANVTGMSAAAWETGWFIQYDNPGTDTVEEDAAQCYLVWDDDLTLTFTGTVYLYMTLAYPETDELWDIYVDTYKSSNLVNTFHVFALESEVSHGIVVETKASLYKGVLETGLTASRTSAASTYIAATDEDGLWYYANDSAGRYGYVEYYVVLYNEGPVNLYLNTLEDVLPDSFTCNTIKNPTAITDMTVTDSQGNEVVCKTFDVTAIYASDTNIVSFDLSGGDLGYSDDYERYYLEPGEAAVFTYYVWTNAYADSSDA
ncbi:MAG: hypothetical protein LUG56_04560, partial [Lachnospiraceae bacterium]|nr:hypothetical protein [Lachnospiraceae bacterium]